MFRYLYDWVQDLAFCLVLFTALIQALPNSGYKKYIRFFTGMILILMMLSPILNIFGKDSQVYNFYKSREYEKKIEEIEKSSEYLNDTKINDILKSMQEVLPEKDNEGEETDKSRIEVEEIRIEK